ncbi:MAG: 4-hydroxy-tetrahydrodipicolinate reductase [Clostridiales bacterium]|nr:4-hydroxy-tetrahydrodipicolinate reductase [Clostridiales bacterium]
MLKIIMHGCCGAMGHAICKLCKDNDEFTVVAGVDKITECDEYDFPIFGSPAECDVDFDVIIDFSNKSAVDAITDYAVAKGKPIVCCTTALTEETVSHLKEASKVIPVFKSANMSVGINVMVELVKTATKALYKDCDIEIVEAHHHRKLDAPSGTALMIADAAKSAMTDEAEYVYDRHSVNEARKHNQIGISSIRGGNIVGEHEIMFISDEETVSISHSAKTRDVFAKGSLIAAAFVKNAAPGMYDMSDVISKAFES